MVDTFGTILTFLPLILVLWLANMGERLRERGEPFMLPVVVSYTFLIIIDVFLILMGVAMPFVRQAMQTQPQLFGQLSGSQQAALEPASWAWLTWGTVAPGILGIVLLLKPVRRALAKVIAIDPVSPVHAVALSMTMFVVVNLALTLGVGLGTLSAEVARQAKERGGPPVSLAALWTQTAMFVLLALIGVGWLSRRSLRAVLQRLGLVKPTGRQVLIGVGVAIALVPTVMIIEQLGRLVGVGVSQDVESLTEQLLGPIFSSPLGIISIGLAAAIGEEMVFRGAVQPRFGVALTAVLFALLHGNYGLSLATFVVLVLGVVLGLERKYFNTTTSMITHALYNSTLAALSFLAAQVLSQAK